MTENKSDEFQVRVAGPEDGSALLLLINTAYRGEASKKGWTTEANLLTGSMRIDMENLGLMLRDPDTTFLKCTLATGALMGCLCLQRKGDKAYLGLFSVWPELQGKGVGKKLLDAAQRWTLDLGLKRIYMHVISARKELIDWYCRHGFQSTGRTLPFYPDERFGKPTQPLEFLELEKEV